MTAEKIFVGRKAELEQFKKIIENPLGQAVLVVGQTGVCVAHKNIILANIDLNRARLG
ncbi:MAG: hypothetical protein ACYTGS_14515 [Planctomycetota bacterium]|jgi:hypothetical protein